MKDGRASNGFVEEGAIALNSPLGKHIKETMTDFQKPSVSDPSD
jgi:CubicO group peptidase (beta-lactamase class C family)